MAKEPLKIQDLFPTAQPLFPAPGRGGRTRLRLFAWALLGAIVAFIGHRVRVWLSHRS